MGYTINNAVINTPLTGVCDIDREKAVKYFTDKCFIYRWHDEYRLLRTKYKRVIALKVSIKKDDALFLIEKLKLKEVKSSIFKNASSYYLTTQRKD